MRGGTVTMCGGSVVCARGGSGDICIKLSGAVVANLEKAAEVMNGMGWLCGGNSALSVLAGFVLPFSLSNWSLASGEVGCCGGIKDAIDEIVDGVDTGADRDVEERGRRDELRAAFRAAFGIR